MHVKIIVSEQEARNMNEAFSETSPGVPSGVPKRQYVADHDYHFKNGSLEDFLDEEKNPAGRFVLRTLLRRSPGFLESLHELFIIILKQLRDADLPGTSEMIRLSASQVIESSGRRFDREATPLDKVNWEYERVMTEGTTAYHGYDFSPYVGLILDETVPALLLTLADLQTSMRQTGSRRTLSPEIYELMTMMYTLDVEGQRYLVPQARKSGAAHGILMLPSADWTRVLSSLGIETGAEQFTVAMDYAPEWVQKLFISYLLHKHQHVFIDAKVLLTDKTQLGRITKWSQLFYGASMLPSVYSAGDGSVNKNVGKLPLWNIYNKRVVKNFMSSPLGKALNVRSKKEVTALFRTGPKNYKSYMKKMVNEYWSDENITAMIPELQDLDAKEVLIINAFRGTYLPVLRNQVLRNTTLGIFARSRDAIIEYTEVAARKSTVRGEIELKFNSSQL